MYLLTSALFGMSAISSPVLSRITMSQFVAADLVIAVISMKLVFNVTMRSPEAIANVACVCDADGVLPVTVTVTEVVLSSRHSTVNFDKSTGAHFNAFVPSSVKRLHRCRAQSPVW